MDTTKQIQQTILSMLEQRKQGATICPSEVPRRLFPDHWREHMAQTRQVAKQLALQNKIEICQKGVAIENDKPIKGPIRLRLKQS